MISIAQNHSLLLTLLYVHRESVLLNGRERETRKTFLKAKKIKTFPSIQVHLMSVGRSSVKSRFY